MRSHLEYCIQLKGPQYKKDMNLLEGAQKMATKTLGVLEHPSSEESMRELSSFSLEKRRVHGQLILAFQYIKGAYKRDRERLLPGPVAIGQGVMVLN